MRISCPHCHTNYRVDSSHIGQKGRRVRCGRCNHSWRQQPEAPESALDRMQAELLATFMLSTLSRSTPETIE